MPPKRQRRQLIQAPPPLCLHDWPNDHTGQRNRVALPIPRFEDAMIVWVGFIVLVVTLLLLDLFVLHRKSEVMTIQQAFAWTGFWISLAMAFNVFVYLLYEENLFNFVGSNWHPGVGTTAAKEFLAGYLIEESLSVDNIFVIALIFAYFAIPAQNQRRVLFWGIFGAIVLRFIMIFLGAVLLKRFEWVEQVFGAILLLSAAKMMFMHEGSVEPEKSFAVRWVRRYYPVAPHLDGHHFFTMIDGKKAATRLLLALAVVETTDVIFAVDSIPAVFSVTRDPFIVFTSNVFAILGLRSLYFAIAGMLVRFRHLQKALVVLLAFIGIKMLLGFYYHLPIEWSLAIIISILAIGIIASIATDRGRVNGEPHHRPPHEPEDHS
jgi:tellurite resistance protein TerC